MISKILMNQIVIAHACLSNNHKHFRCHIEPDIETVLALDRTHQGSECPSVLTALSLSLASDSNLIRFLSSSGFSIKLYFN